MVTVKISVKVLTDNHDHVVTKRLDIYMSLHSYFSTHRSLMCRLCGQGFAQKCILIEDCKINKRDTCQ